MALRATILVVASGILLSGFCLSRQTTVEKVPTRHTSPASAQDMYRDADLALFVADFCAAPNRISEVFFNPQRPSVHILPQSSTGRFEVSMVLARS